MEEFSEELGTPKQRPSNRSSFDLLELIFNAVLRCLGFLPVSEPSSKQGEDTKNHQTTSYDTPPSTEEAQDSPLVSGFEKNTSEDIAVIKSLTATTIDAGKGPEVNSDPSNEVSKVLSSCVVP